MAATPAGAERLQAETPAAEEERAGRGAWGGLILTGRGAHAAAPGRLACGSRDIIEECVICVVVAAGLVAFAIASQADVVTVEQIICKLNGDIITNLDLDHDRADLEKQMRANGYTGKRLEDALKAEAPNLLRNKIDNLLLVQKGKELELKVDPDVNKYLADLQRQTNTADPEKFQALVRQETGKSYEDFKADLKNNFYVQGVVSEEVMRKIQFTTEEVRAYYDAHKDEFQRQERVFLREIAISTKARGRCRAWRPPKRKPRIWWSRARRGERFNELAQANSDSATAKDGGALDPYKKGDLAPAIEAAVWDKERGYTYRSHQHRQLAC